MEYILPLIQPDFENIYKDVVIISDTEQGCTAYNVFKWP